LEKQARHECEFYHTDIRQLARTLGLWANVFHRQKYRELSPSACSMRQAIMNSDLAYWC